MKNLNIKNIPGLLLMFSLFFIGCNQGGEKATDTAKNPDNVAGTVAGNGTIANTQVAVEDVLAGYTMNFRQNTRPAFKAGLQKVMNTYLAMKDAFVKDNAIGVNEEPVLMANALNQMPDNQLSGEALTYWQEKKDFLR